jgi:hypothetical protein
VITAAEILSCGGRAVDGATREGGRQSEVLLLVRRQQLQCVESSLTPRHWHKGKGHCDAAVPSDNNLQREAQKR